MNFIRLIEILKTKNIKKVIVFGPPRSGSTVSSFALAKELDIELILENRANNMSPKQVLRFFEKSNGVMHANVAIKWIHKIKNPNIAKVIMRRNCNDILASADKFANKMVTINNFYNNKKEISDN